MEKFFDLSKINVFEYDENSGSLICDCGNKTFLINIARVIDSSYYISSDVAMCAECAKIYVLNQKTRQIKAEKPENNPQAVQHLKAEISAWYAEFNKLEEQDYDNKAGAGAFVEWVFKQKLAAVE